MKGRTKQSCYSLVYTVYITYSHFPIIFKVTCSFLCSFVLFFFFRLMRAVMRLRCPYDPFALPRISVKPIVLTMHINCHRTLLIFLYFALPNQILHLWRFGWNKVSLNLLYSIMQFPHVWIKQLQNDWCCSKLDERCPTGLMWWELANRAQTE